MHSVEWAQAGLPVVVGVDGSRTGPATIDLAAAEAVRHRAPLLIVHVWPGRYTGVYRSRNVVPSEADGRHLLEVSARRVRLAAPELKLDTELLHGAAANVLTRCSERARLIVVGHRDEAVARSGWGSTAAYLAHHSTCPLLVSRGAAPHGGPVVVAVSARSPATATLAYGYAEAALLGSHLVAVHVRTRADAREGRWPVTLTSGYAAARREERLREDALGPGAVGAAGPAGPRRGRRGPRTGASATAVMTSRPSRGGVWPRARFSLPGRGR
jgi:nucleotide-binding universal stress UspA family protein